MRTLIFFLSTITVYAQIPTTGTLGIKSGGGIPITHSISQHVDGNETGTKTLRELCDKAGVSPCNMLAFRGWNPGAPPHGQYPPITIDCYNTSDALDSQLTVNFQNITGDEPYVPPFNPPYNEEIGDSGIEAYYHTVRVTVTNTSPYDVAVTILVEQFSGDTHSVNINFVVGTNSSDYREFTLPYNPGPGGLLNRTISIVLSEGG